MKKDIRELAETTQKYNFIKKQMAKKVYPLVGADTPFQLLEAENF